MQRKKAAPASQPGRVSPTAPESRSLSTVIWEHLESLPDFNERLDSAKADLDAGRGIPFEETRRRRR